MPIKTTNDPGKTWPPVPKADRASTLVPKLLEALSKPGIKRSSIFKGPHPEKVFAYSAHPTDPTKLVREAFDGTRQVGRIGRDGRFRPSVSAV